MKLGSPVTNVLFLNLRSPFNWFYSSGIECKDTITHRGQNDCLWCSSRLWNYSSRTEQSEGHFFLYLSSCPWQPAHWHTDTGAFVYMCVCSCRHTCMHMFIFEKTYLWILMVQMQPATSNKLSLDSGAGCSSNGEFWKLSRKLDFTFYTRYIFPLRFTSQSVQRLIYVSKSLLCSSSALEVSAAFCICSAVRLESLLLLVRISLLNFFY